MKAKLLARNLKHKRNSPGHRQRLKLTRCDSNPRLVLDKVVTRALGRPFYGLKT